MSHAIFAYQTAGYDLEASVAQSLYALSAKEYVIVRAVAARMLRADEPPEGTAPYPAPEELGVASQIDVFVARLDDANRREYETRSMEPGSALRIPK